MPVDWICRGELVDEGPKTAVYPYPYVGLKEIASVADCRSAVKDIGGPACEDEFGVGVMAPYYDLLWALNTTDGLCTSHTVFSNAETQPDFEWATHIFGSLTVIQPRTKSQQFEREAAFAICRFIDALIAGTPADSRECTKGRRLRIRPVYIDHACYPDPSGRTVGFGCQIIVSGNAGTRLEAARRWGAAIRFILNAIENRNSIHGFVEPHQHLAPCSDASMRAVPRSSEGAPSD